MITYKEFGSERIEEVKRIYRREEWNAYLRNDAALVSAYDHSLLCYGAFDENDNLIGLIRCVGDAEHILVIQDLIVDRPYQKRGIGTTLFRYVWDRYAHVRMFQVVTDLTDEVDNKFYRSFGMKPLADGHMISYFRE